MSAKALRTKYSRMKIGIITLPLETNYGGLLQNYALQQILHKCGHEAYTIDCKFPKNAYTSNKPYKYLLFRIRQIKRRNMFIFLYILIMLTFSFPISI